VRVLRAAAVADDNVRLGGLLHEYPQVA